jgi:hypothetical protein
MGVDGGEADVRIDLPSGVKGEFVPDVSGVTPGRRAQKLTAGAVDPVLGLEPPEKVEVRGKREVVARVGGEEGMKVVEVERPQ